ncbi:MAG: M24 family metallopeptidase, partial [Burkholderiaceae bacterium]|nr:M24 family metallopeptidase [Burkholderiaceae bacterium]
PTPAYVGQPTARLLHTERARQVMRDRGLALLCASTDENLCYLSGHASDSTLCHFFDRWAAAVFPASPDIGGALIVPDYDLAYQVTRPTWLPETLSYGWEYSSAGVLLDAINKGLGIETDLRAPLRALFQRTRASASADLVSAIAAYIGRNFPKGEVKVGFDDLRIAAEVRAKVGDRLTTVDALFDFRRIRAVKTDAEIDLLRKAARINEAAVAAASKVVKEGALCADMVRAYRGVLADRGAKPLGERGMLFVSGPDGAFVLDHDYVEQKRFKGGESVVLDAISQFRLYHADMARTAVIGGETKRHREVYAAVAEALAAAEAQIKPGVHTSAMTKAAATVLQKHGLDPRLTSLLVHPIGLQVFDWGTPEDEHTGWVVQANQVLNFEVFYRDPTTGGMHLEDSLLVTDTAVESLSTFSRDLIEA